MLFSGVLSARSRSKPLEMLGVGAVLIEGLHNVGALRRQVHGELRQQGPQLALAGPHRPRNVTKTMKKNMETMENGHENQ